jgi:hypothetical protein
MGTCRSTIDEKVTEPAVTGVRDDVSRLHRERHCRSGFSRIMKLLREGPSILIKDIPLCYVNNKRDVETVTHNLICISVLLATCFGFRE